ncbi:hypothetical protein D043_4101B, partial [Vibrio parahaemolyticus EKP-021]
RISQLSQLAVRHDQSVLGS